MKFPTVSVKCFVRRPGESWYFVWRQTVSIVLYEDCEFQMFCMKTVSLMKTECKMYWRLWVSNILYENCECQMFSMKTVSFKCFVRKLWVSHNLYENCKCQLFCIKNVKIRWQDIILLCPFLKRNTISNRLFDRQSNNLYSQ